MQITLKPMRRAGSGYALIITLTFLATTLLLLSGMMMWTASNANQAARNNQFNQSEAAAEAATEMIFSQMNRDFNYGKLNSASSYNTLIPDSSTWPDQYTFSDTNGNANTTSVSFDQTSGTNLVALNSQYQGLQGFVQNCQIISVATPNNALYNVPATVSQTFQGAKIPIFQFAIFYNLNMEMDPTPVMKVTGPVYCNQGMWITCINGLTFNSTVQAVGSVTLNTAADPFANGYSYGGSTAVTFLKAKQPSSGNNALTIPIAGNASSSTNPTNIEAILNLPPAALGAPNTTAYTESNQVYLFNESDIIISNCIFGTNGIAANPAFLTGTTVNNWATNFTVWYQDKYNTPILQQITNDYLIQKKPGTNYASTNILYAGFSFLTNVVFYDWREGWNGGSGPPKPVQAVQIDIGKFNKWLTNSAGQGPAVNSDIVNDLGHGIGSIYVYNAVPMTSSKLPAVRLAGGSNLPAAYPGLTVSTPQPVYIWKDYNVQRQGASATLNSSNTANTYPAAVLADSVTILSDNWSDSLISQVTPLAMTPTATTINAALFEGIVQSNPNISGTYSGGVENFLRMLENWNNTIPLTYNGSMVVMFPSIYATNYFKAGGNYYNPPIRNWAFDNNYTNLAGLPPLTPCAKALIRGNWLAY